MSEDIFLQIPPHRDIPNPFITNIISLEECYDVL